MKGLRLVLILKKSNACGRTPRSKTVLNQTARCDCELRSWIQVSSNIRVLISG